MNLKSHPRIESRMTKGHDIHELHFLIEIEYCVQPTLRKNLVALTTYVVKHKRD